MSGGKAAAGGAIPMPPSRLDRRRGLVGHRDRSQRTHFGLAPRFGVAHLTADALLDGLFRQRLLALHEPSFLLLALVFDGVVDRDDLERAWQALPTAYRSADGVCLEWLDREGRLQRRLLGSVTVLALTNRKHRGTFEDAAGQLLTALSSQESIAADLAAVLSIVRTRLATALPGDLLAHVIGDHPLSAVPRSCLARRDAKRALFDQSRHASAERSLDDSLRWRVADAAFTPSLAGEAVEALSLVRAIRDACRADSIEPNPVADRRRMARELEALAPACVAIGGWVCVLWAWAADLVGRGTNRTQPLSPHSIDPYVSLTLGELHRRVSGGDMDDASDIDWVSLYDEIEQAPSILPTQRGKAAAALTAWHEYLVEHFGVSPLERPLDAEGDAPLPRANIVWPHEQAWMQEHLAARATRSRFDAQIAAVAALLCAAAMRSQELWHIHLFGVQVTAEVVALYVDPLPSAGHGKSRNARRVIEVASAPACLLLREWVARRVAEGALATDLLFGDPVDPGAPYRRGSTEASLNAWLKAATGDGSVSIHTLRHTFVSLARAGDRSGDEPGDQRALDESSAQAGHGSTQMSIDHYCHRYEPALRRALDDWQRRRTLTESRVCALTGMRPGRLRQRWHRSGDADHMELAWHAIDEAAAMVDMPLAGGTALADPRQVPLCAVPALSPGAVLGWLVDLCVGRAADVVRLRHEIGLDEWDAFEATIRAWHVRRRGKSVRDQLASASRPGIPFASGFRHLGQPKLRRLADALRSASDPDDAAPPIQTWLDNLHGVHLGLEDAYRMLPLLRWLCAGGVEGAQVVVCHDRHQVDAATESADVVEMVFGAAPTIRPEKSRAGRPSVYLMLRAVDEPSNARANAATSVMGLHALLFSAWVWLQMRARRHGDG